MPVYSLTRTQKVPAPLPQLWDFITSPTNLKLITPAYMGFEILTPNLPEKIYPGMIISYHVTPVAGIKMLWVTEITQVKEYAFFVDDQRVGPYSLWHHQHHIQKIDGGVLMTDIVNYQPPLGPLGAIANALFLKRQLNEIFAFRFSAMERIFGKF
jgi:ligand-binding SRPBCC domain-containing protein